MAETVVNTVDPQSQQVTTNQTQSPAVFMAGNRKIDKVQFENALSQSIQPFLQSYAPQWGDKKTAEVQNVLSQMINDIHNNNNSYIDLTGTIFGTSLKNNGKDDDPTAYAAYMINQVAQSMPTMQDKTTTKKTYGNDTFMNNFYKSQWAGTPNPQDWLNLDPEVIDKTTGNKSKGYKNRLIEFNKYLDSEINKLGEYQEAGDAYGNMDVVKNRMLDLKNRLSDGIITPDDKLAMTRLGFDPNYFSTEVAQQQQQVDPNMQQQQQVQEPVQQNVQQPTAHIQEGEVTDPAMLQKAYKALGRNDYQWIEYKIVNGKPMYIGHRNAVRTLSNQHKPTPQEIAGNRIVADSWDNSVDTPRAAAMAADLGALVTSFLPGYGTAASGVLGLGSMAGNLMADINDKSVSSGDVWKNLATNAGLTAVGMLPGGKSAGVLRNAVRLLPKAWAYAQAYNLVTDKNVQKSVEKALSSGERNKLTVDDWKNLAGLFSAVSGAGRTAAHSVKNYKTFRHIRSGESNQVKVTTAKGKSIVMDKADYEAIHEAGKSKGQAAAEAKAKDLHSKYKLDSDDSFTGFNYSDKTGLKGKTIGKVKGFGDEQMAKENVAGSVNEKYYNRVKQRSDDFKSGKVWNKRWALARAMRLPTDFELATGTTAQFINGDQKLNKPQWLSNLGKSKLLREVDNEKTVTANQVKSTIPHTTRDIGEYQKFKSDLQQSGNPLPWNQKSVVTETPKTVQQNTAQQLSNSVKNANTETNINVKPSSKKAINWTQEKQERLANLRSAKAKRLWEERKANLKENNKNNKTSLKEQKNAAESGSKQTKSSKKENGGKLDILNSYKQGGLLIPKYQNAGILPNLYKKYPGKGFGYSGGVNNTQNNTTWINNVFNPTEDYIIDQLAKYGKDDTYGNWINGMQHDHSVIYNNAGGEKGNFLNKAYNKDATNVKNYQTAYWQDKLSKADDAYKQANPYGYNSRSIVSARNAGRYKMIGTDKRNTQDSFNTQYTPDGSYSGITDDRRILGRKGSNYDDWQDADRLKKWQDRLHSVGWDMYLDPTDNYYKIKRWNDPTKDPNNPVNPNKPVDTNNPKDPGVRPGINQQTKQGYDLSSIMPQLLASDRLIGDINATNRRRDDLIARYRNISIPVTNQYAHQVTDDYAGNQAVANQASKLIAQASKPVTSDANVNNARQLEAQMKVNDMNQQQAVRNQDMIQKHQDIAEKIGWQNSDKRTQLANTVGQKLDDLNRMIANIHQQADAANQTSIDSYKMQTELDYKQKLEEQKAIQDQYNAQKLGTLNAAQSRALALDPELGRMTTEYQNLQKEIAQLQSTATTQDQVNVVNQKLQDLDNLANNIRYKQRIIMNNAERQWDQDFTTLYGIRTYNKRVQPGDWLPPVATPRYTPSNVVSAKNGSSVNVFMDVDGYKKITAKDNDRFMKSIWKAIDTYLAQARMLQ